MTKFVYSHIETRSSGKVYLKMEIEVQDIDDAFAMRSVLQKAINDKEKEEFGFKMPSLDPEQRKKDSLKDLCTGSMVGIFPPIRS